MANQELLPPEEPGQVATIEVDPNDCGEFTLAPQAEFKRVVQLSNFVRKSRVEIRSAFQRQDEVTAAILQAAFLRELRKAISGPVLEDIKQLAGSRNGFRTDLDHTTEGYGDEIIREFAISAFASGLRLVGNECNLFQKQLYITKEGFEALLDRECDGLTDFRFELSSPDWVWSDKTTGKGVAKGTAYVSGSATWRVDGKPEQMEFNERDSGDFRIAIKCFDTDTDMLIRGKAERQVFKRVYKQITGSALTVDQDEPIEVEAPVAKTPPPVDLPKLLDEVEKWLNLKLAESKTIKDAAKFGDAAIDRLRARHDLSEEQFVMATEYVMKLVNARTSEIRGSRKGADKSE